MSAFISIIAALVLLSNASTLVGEQSLSLDVRARQAECFCLEYSVRNDDYESESREECSCSEGVPSLEIKQQTDVRTSLNIHKSSRSSCKNHCCTKNQLIQGGIERSVCMLKYRLLNLISYENAGLKTKVPMMTFQEHQLINLSSRDF